MASTVAIQRTARLAQGVLALIYPARCVLCDASAAADHALCGECWGEARFPTGLVCDLCGDELPGQSDTVEVCDSCLAAGRPWSQGRAAMLYEGSGRRLVLRLKHGDRPDLARTAATWMARAGAECLEGDALIVPVPIHWSRRVARRYNQAAELGRWLAREAGREFDPRALVRIRATRSQDHGSVTDRQENVAGAIAPGPRHLMSGRHVCLVDDVMTSGATLGTSARAAFDGGASRVSVLVLARVTLRP